MSSDFYCGQCRSPLTELFHHKPARREVCPQCSADLHACCNCRFYDPSAYNECTETQAERVVDKQKSNFCDYFYFRQGKPEASPSNKEEALKKLDDLFK